MNIMPYWVFIESDGHDTSALKEQLTEHGIPWLDIHDNRPGTTHESWPPIPRDPRRAPKFLYSMLWGYITFSKEPHMYEDSKTLRPQWVIRF